MIQAHFITNINIKHQTITCVWCWTFQKLLSTSSLLFPLSVVCYDYQLHLLPLTITRLHKHNSWCQIYLYHPSESVGCYYPPESVGSTTLIATGSMLWSATIPCTPLLLTQTTITEPLTLPLSLCRSRLEKWSRYVYRWDFRIVVCILSSHEWLVKWTQSVRHREISIILLS